MGSKTTYFCDRCGVELDSALRLFQVSLGSEAAGDGMPKYQHFAVCDACFGVIKEFIEKKVKAE